MHEEDQRAREEHPTGVQGGRELINGQAARRRAGVHRRVKRGHGWLRHLFLSRKESCPCRLCGVPSAEGERENKEKCSDRQYRFLDFCVRIDSIVYGETTKWGSTVASTVDNVVDDTVVGVVVGETTSGGSTACIASTSRQRGRGS